MITIPINGQVVCTDGSAGKSAAIIINPIAQKLTHFVVSDQTTGQAIERLVPVDLVTETSSNKIYLNCTIAEFVQLEVFSEMHFIKNEEDPIEYLEPFITPLDLQYTTIETEHIPPGELAIRRGSQIEATDGHIGAVGEFLVDPNNGQITHLVLQKGHLWGKKDVTLPVTTIERIGQKTVYLNLSQAELAELPTIPVRRNYKGKTNIELMIWTFAGEHTAVQGLNTLKESKDMSLLNSAILAKDKEGKTSIKEAEDLDTRHGAIFGAITGGLIGLIGGPMGLVLGAAAGALTGGAAANWIDMGFDNERLEDFLNKLQADSSALILMVENKDIDQIMSALSKLNGDWIQQSVTDHMVDMILSNHKDNSE